MATSKKPYERPTIVDLGSIADHTYGGQDDYVYRCGGYDNWSGGTVITLKDQTTYLAGAPRA